MSPRRVITKAGGVRVGRFVRGKGLAKALRAQLKVEMRRWAEGQLRRLGAAFVDGGHQGKQRGGPRWAKRKKRVAWPILDRTGRLKRGTRFDMRGSNQHGVNAAFRNSTPYARYHQRGTIHMPARPVLVVTRRDAGRLKERITKWARRRINGRNRIR